MNRDYQKALLLLGALGSLVTVASAQVSPEIQWWPGPPVHGWQGPPNLPGSLPSLDWVLNCEDQTLTTPIDPYSTDYGIEAQYDSLFGAVMGVSGTVNFSKTCFGPSGITLPVAGRLGFFIGADDNPNMLNGQTNPNYGYGGTNQDRLAGTLIDDGMGLTMGTYSGVSGNWAIAKIFQGAATGTTTTGSYFGSSTIDTAYWGASDRYFVCESTNSNVRAVVRVDVIGDAARIDWKFENTSTAAAIIGMWFGQWVEFLGPQGPYSPDYITAPGYKPISNDTRFANAPVTNPTDGIPQLQQPGSLNFGMYQSWAYGLQIVLQPSPQIPDQTQVDSIDVGKNAWLLGSMTASDGAMPDLMIPDTTFILAGGQGSLGADAYIEKWNPAQVAAFDGSGVDDTREIVAYYRGTWSSSDYAKPYSVVLDAPPVIATSPNNPASFQNAAPISITVQIDDTRGFSTSDQSIALQDVEVDLDLPSGMTDYNNSGSSHLVQYIPVVPPQTVQYVTFQVAISPTVVGSQQYIVTVIPNPGQKKVLTGTIVVASQPYLKLGPAANLVTAPWQFGSGDWSTILSTSPTFTGQNPPIAGPILDQDYQAFGWDAVAQDYVLQTGPQRGYGTFLIWNSQASSQAFLSQPIQFGGSPAQVQDLESGAPQIILQPGWNLIANPYNYAIPLGEIVGVAEAENNTAYTFTQLASLGYISGYLAYWDNLTQGYQDISNFDDLLQPNTGYWIYVPSSQPVTIEYPPVFQAFIPGLTDPFETSAPKKKIVKSGLPVTATPTWSLQLAARQNGVVDGKAAIGQADTATHAKLLTKFKAPIAPLKNAIQSAIAVQNGKKTTLLSQSLVAKTVTSQTWNWQVYTTSTGAVSLTWPNIASLPENIDVKLTDVSTGKTEDLRSISNYTFAGQAQSIHNFKLVVKVGPVVPTIESVTATSKPSQANVVYNLSVNAQTTVTIQQNGQVVAMIVNNRSDKAGSSSTSWNLLDSANRRVKAGTYQVVVTSTPAGGSSSSKSASIVVGR
jgi:hypothetical protein